VIRKREQELVHFWCQRISSYVTGAFSFSECRVL